MLTCTFEDGGQNNLRHVVTSSLVIKNDKILLVRRSPASFTCPNRWALPGGYVDFNELIEAAAIREVKEETGYLVKIDRLILINDRPDRKNEDRQNIEFLYLVKPLKKISVPDHEIAQTKWYPLYALPPEEVWAFDHFEAVALFREYLDHPVTLPILNARYG